jgi:predicted nucleotidyltransferase
VDHDFAVDPHDARRFFEAKAKKRSEALAAMHARALADAERIVAMIRETYRPRRIWQWGSLLFPERFSEISDIDIAVEGLEGVEKYFDLLGASEDMTEFPVDIVELEKIESIHADSIRREGRLVYERD